MIVRKNIGSKKDKIPILFPPSVQTNIGTGHSLKAEDNETQYLKVPIDRF